MRIVLATPIYPPDIGGPAVYAQKLKEGLEKRGNAIKVVSYRGLARYPQPLRILFYFLNLFKNALNCDLIYIFNLTSCGLPAYWVSHILKKKFIVRIGGDFLWERAVESGRTKETLSEYYQSPKMLKEKFWIWLMGKILNKADKIIFTSKFQRDIYLKTFRISEEKTAIIGNPFPRLNFQIVADMPSNNYQLLYAGRLIKLKNLDFFIDVFNNVLGRRPDQNLTLKIIGEGPERENLKSKIRNLKLENRIFLENHLPQSELFKEIQKSYLCVLPSLSEITPNFALECIKLQKPILLTKEVSYYEILKDSLIFIDPKNENDWLGKIIQLLDGKNYLSYLEKIKKIPAERSWEDVVEDHGKNFPLI